jgi:hypothetical protein
MSTEKENTQHRQTNPLLPTVHEVRRRSQSDDSEEDDEGMYLTGSLKYTVPDTVPSPDLSRKRSIAALQSWGLDDSDSDDDEFVSPGSPGSGSLFEDGEVNYVKRREAICYLFLLAGSPEKDQWQETKIVTKIMKRLFIPRNSRTSVEKILTDVLEARAADEEYDPRTGTRQRGRNVIIEDLTPVGNLVCELFDRSLRPSAITMMVNARLVANGFESISQDAIQSYVDRSPLINKTKRKTKKSGKEDLESDWAKARVVQCEQFLEQLNMAELDASDNEEAELLDEYAADNLKPMHVDGLVFWDEKHKKCVLGPTGKFDYQIRRDPVTGEIADEEHGGVFAGPRKRTSVKYPKEARGAFGVAMRKLADGSYEGVKCEPFWYTEKTLLSIKDFKKHLEHERLDKLAQGKIKTPKGKDSVWKGGYEQRYGDRWREKLEENVKKTKASVKDLIDHIIEESVKVYAGTPMEHCFLIYHDHLKILWSAEGVAYLKEIGWYGRFLKIEGSNNGRIAPHYRYCVVGDSPELARALDSFGFADLETAIAFHAALTSRLAIDDPRRFKLGTPEELQRTMARCWEVAPSSERIVEDILKFKMVCQMIVDHDGCVVPDEDFRSGGRARMADATAGTASASRKRYRKKGTAMNFDIHEDAMECYGHITQSSGLDAFCGDVADDDHADAMNIAMRVHSQAPL